MVRIEYNVPEKGAKIDGELVVSDSEELALLVSASEESISVPKNSRVPEAATARLPRATTTRLLHSSSSMLIHHSRAQSLFERREKG